MLVGEVPCVCRGPVGTHKPVLLCTASPGTPTLIPYAHGPQNPLWFSPGPCPLGSLTAGSSASDPPSSPGWTSQVKPRPPLSPCICLTVSTARGPGPVTTPALLPLLGAGQGHCPACAVGWPPAAAGSPPLGTRPTLPAPQQDSR